jgi:hypothetical protein
MKKIIFTSIALFTIFNAQAQFLDLKGIVVNANSHMYISDNDIKTETTSQLYHFSFTDNILVHTILLDGAVDVSQIYKLTVDSKFMDGDITVFKCSALSGVSGNTFKYEIKIDKSGKLLAVVIIQPNGIDKDTYKGGIVELKTFKS